MLLFVMYLTALQLTLAIGRSFSTMQRFIFLVVELSLAKSWFYFRGLTNLFIIGENIPKPSCIHIIEKSNGLNYIYMCTGNTFRIIINFIFRKIKNAKLKI